MRVLFIRHAEAEASPAGAEEDLERKLTRKGERVMKTVARCLARRFDRPDRIISSKAIRARESAEILCSAFGAHGVELEARLNPGASPADYLRLLAEAWKKDEALLVMVGHEPELSAVVSTLVSDGHLELKFKKSACADLQFTSPTQGILRALLDPALL